MKKILYSVMFGADAYPFQDLAEEIRVVRSPDAIIDPNSLLVVWGGADISPSLYNHPTSKRTYCYSNRDVIEWACMQKAKTLGIPIIGVCRGAQMLCALAGGFLIQDVQNHAGRGHMVTTYDGSVLPVNSIHHQMMCGLENTKHELLAWSSVNLSKEYIYKNDLVYKPDAEFREPEAVWFSDVKGLAIQWHPEAMVENCEATEFVIKEYHARCEPVAQAA